MDVRTPGMPLRHLGSIVGALIVAAIAALWITQAGGGAPSTARTSDVAAARAIFGVGRETVSTTPRTDVTATIVVPDGIDPDTVSWTLSALAAGTPYAGASGTGTVVRFTTPGRGSLVLHATTRVDGHGVAASTTFVVAPASSYAATEVTTTGTVLVNGAPAVQGEALASRTRIDADDGSITYLARASSRTGLDGEITMSGTEFLLATRKLPGGRVFNVASVARSEGETNTLHAEVEHLDGQRYVAVQTPDAVAMVKGTGFDTSVAPDDTGVEVDHGIVMVIDRYRLYVAPTDVTTGEEATVERTEVAEAAEEWLGAADPAAGTIDAAPLDTTTGAEAPALEGDLDLVGTGPADDDGSATGLKSPGGDDGSWDGGFGDGSIIGGIIEEEVVGSDDPFYKDGSGSTAPDGTCCNGSSGDDTKPIYDGGDGTCCTTKEPPPDDPCCDTTDPSTGSGGYEPPPPDDTTVKDPIPPPPDNTTGGGTDPNAGGTAPSGGTGGNAIVGGA